MSKASSTPLPSRRHDLPQPSPAAPVTPARPQGAMGAFDAQAHARTGHRLSQYSVFYPPIQTKAEDDGREMLQMKIEGTQAPHSEVPAAGGGGSPLSPPVRQTMERSFRHSFANVRVHSGDEAKRVGALAYTRGADIHFQPGRYDPDSLGGLELLGHELTHVVQQDAGRVTAPQSKAEGTAPINADPGLEAEADAMGARAARGQSSHVRGASGDGLQRKADVVQCWPWSKKSAPEPQPYLPDPNALSDKEQEYMRQRPNLAEEMLQISRHTRPEVKPVDTDQTDLGKDRGKDASEAKTTLSAVAPAFTVGAGLSRTFGNKTVQGITHDNGSAALEAGGILGDVGSVLSMGGNMAGIAQGVDLMKGDAAQRQLGKDRVIDSGISLVQSATTAAKGIGNTVETFQGATGPAADFIPGLGLATASIGAGRDIYEANEHRRLVGKQAKLKKDALADDNQGLADALGRTGSLDKHQTARSAVSASANILKVGGNAVTLSGVAAPVGMGMTLAGTGLSVTAKGVAELVDSNDAGRQQSVQFGVQAGDRAAEQRAFRNNSNYAVLAQVKLAQDGDPTALAAMKARGISDKVLQSPPTHVRDLILNQVDDKAKPENIRQRVVGGVKKLKGKIGNALFDTDLEKLNDTEQPESAKPRKPENLPVGLQLNRRAHNMFGSDFRYAADPNGADGQAKQSVTPEEHMRLYKQMEETLAHKDQLAKQKDVAGQMGTEKSHRELEAYQQAFGESGLPEELHPLRTTRSGMLLSDVKRIDLDEQLAKNSGKRIKQDAALQEFRAKAAEKQAEKEAKAVQKEIEKARKEAAKNSKTVSLPRLEEEYR